MILEILLGLFILLSVFFGILIFYSLRRINQFENIVVEIQKIIEIATSKMKAVDASGHYESDDETGFFFEQLKDLQLLLDKLFESQKEQ
tara:strand:+ start:299 stop:565 length:267 start_codon:yes stop_codon:yes gene_type:complete